MDNRVQLQPAYVLFSQPFQNTSLMVDFFTIDYGRIRVIAKGARRRTSKYRALLQPFHPLLIAFSGRGEVKTLGYLESGFGAIVLKGERLFSGLYLNEILCRLLHNYEEHKSLYKSYQDTLVSLQGPGDLENILRVFELRLLAELGYAINLSDDYVTNEPITKGKLYKFIPDFGFEMVILSKDEEFPDNVFEGETLIAIREMNMEGKTVAKSAKRLLRLAFASLLGEKPLNSRNLFASN